MKISHLNKHLFENFKSYLKLTVYNKWLDRKDVVDKLRDVKQVSSWVYKENIDNLLYKKAMAVNSWYTRIIGLDEVKIYQDRVISLQNKLLEAQEKRRSIGSKLSELRKKSNELQEQILKVKRQEDLQKFLDLMREETELLKQEKELSEKFAECDREEREIFTAFTNSICDSNEKQRLQMEYTKYIGLFVSIFGSFLAFVYSSIRKKEIKNIIRENVATNGISAEVMKEFRENQKALKFKMENINSAVLNLTKLINNNNNNKDVQNKFKNVYEEVDSVISKKHLFISLGIVLAVLLMKS